MKLLNSVKLAMENRTLRLENESLKKTLKEQSFKILMDKVNEPYEIEKLRTENKNMRVTIKNLRKILKEERQW